MGIFQRAGNAISAAFASFGALGAAPPTGPTQPNGGDGVQAYGGFLLSDEQRPELVGQRKWVTYSNATNTQVVATGLRRTLDMLAGTEWHCEPNEAGGPDAERGVELVTKGLLKARLPKPWSTIVRKTALYRYYGFALHEWTVTKDVYGDVVFADIAHRPQYTIDRWDKPSEQMPWQAVSQLTKAGNRFVIPRGRLFHAVDDLLTDAPDGVGLLRHVIELVRRLGILEGLEGLAYETDLRGMPMGRAPIGELMAQAQSQVGNDRAKIEAYITDRTQTLRAALQGIVKSPERLQYLLLDSATYQGADPNTISSIQKWAYELLKGNSNGVDTVAAAIGRIQLEIARVLGIEHVMMGGHGGGSLAMHADKTDAFATILQTMLTEIAAFATNDLARVLVGLNGLDPDTAAPTLVAQPIDTEAVADTCAALAALAQAGLAYDDPAIKVIRTRMHLPPPPDPTPEQMGLLGTGGAQNPGPPQPSDQPPDGEVGDQEAPAGPQPGGL